MLHRAKHAVPSRRTTMRAGTAALLLAAVAGASAVEVTIEVRNTASCSRSSVHLKLQPFFCRNCLLKFCVRGYYSRLVHGMVCLGDSTCRRRPAANRHVYCLAGRAARTTCMLIAIAGAQTLVEIDDDDCGERVPTLPRLISGAARALRCWCPPLDPAGLFY